MPTIKTCNGCKADKPVLDFGKLAESKDGLQYKCKPCKKSYDADYRAKNADKIADNHKRHSDANQVNLKISRDKYRSNNPEKLAVYGRKYRTENPEYFAKSSERYKHETPEKVVASQKKHQNENPEKIAANQKKYRQNNPGKINAKNSMRRASKLQATPAWANEKYIKLFYTGAKIEEGRTGRKVHVDHIVPLQGDIVCGLHCEDNLQFLFAEDNIRKSNNHHNTMINY